MHTGLVDLDDIVPDAIYIRLQQSQFNRVDFVFCIDSDYRIQIPGDITEVEYILAQKFHCFVPAVPHIDELHSLAAYLRRNKSFSATRRDDWTLTRLSLNTSAAAKSASLKQ
jgi:hypothetical protein